METRSSPSAPSPDIRPACLQCRGRKVKCDRNSVDGCRSCARLGFACSYVASAAGSQLPQAGELTQAGTARRRVRRACAPCRVDKARCSGNQPCVWCRTRAIECTQTTTPLPHSPSTNVSIPASTESTRTESEVIHALLHGSDLPLCNSLHGPTVLSQWSKHELDPNLLQAMLATAASHNDEVPMTQVRDLMQQLQGSLLLHLDIFNLPRLQAIVLLVELHLSVGNSTDGWTLLAVAARMAFTMKLNYERPELDPVLRETRRRLMWQIFILDRTLSGGLDDLSVCPVERLCELQLPCQDRMFERGIPSRTQTLIPEQDLESSRDMDILAYLIRLYHIRHKILSYTKRVRKDGTSPVISRIDLMQLEQDIASFTTSLPSDLALDPHRLAIMARSRDFPEWFTLHMLRLQCYVDLYRFLVPGIREAVSREAFIATPSEYISYCQTQCLTYSLELCNFWADIHVVRSGEAISSRMFSVIIYQTAQVVTHSYHLFLSDPSSMELGSVQQKLLLAISMVVPPPKNHHKPAEECLKEARRLITNLGGPRPESTVVHHSTHTHMVSKGSFIPRMESIESESSSLASAEGHNKVLPRNETSLSPHHSQQQQPYDYMLDVDDHLIDWAEIDAQFRDYHPLEFELFGICYQ